MRIIKHGHGSIHGRGEIQFPIKIARRVGDMMEMTGLGGFAERNAKTLSGGEVRRVALAVGTSGAVMKNGAIEQSGSMDSVLFSPGNTYMAEFTGTGNILPVMFQGGTGDRRLTFHCAHR